MQKKKTKTGHFLEHSTLFYIRVAWNLKDVHPQNLDTNKSKHLQLLHHQHLPPTGVDVTSC